MPLIFQDIIEVADVIANPGRVYLFGDNEQRTGRGGLAAICRGHANALGIATKRLPSRTPHAYWSDTEFDPLAALIDADLAPAFVHARNGGTVVCPKAGLGTGLAELPTRAPRVFAYLRQRIIELKRTTPDTQVTTVHNLRREPMKPGDIRIDRRTEFGNEFIIGRDGTRTEVIAKFELAERTRLSDAGPSGDARRRKVRDMHGRRLFCWCNPDPCHGHVYAKLAAELVE